MTPIAGYEIKQLPFAQPEKVHDILYSDGPILSHYRDNTGKDLLFYWVDFNKYHNRWLIWETNKKNLYDYLSGGISLYQYLTEHCPDFLFTLDTDAIGNHQQSLLINGYEIPKEYLPAVESHYTLGLPEFYDDYLTEWSYLSNLREQSYIFKMTPTSKSHETTMSAKDAGQFLINITKSIESYIDYTATDRLKKTIGDRSRLNRTVSQIKENLTPRIADTAFGSFEVSIAIDTILLPAGNADINKWGKGLFAAYQNDVLDVDYGNLEEAAVIVERFPDADVRKKIFDPIFKILENKDVSLSVSSYNKRFVRSYNRSRPGEKFKTEVLPKQTIEDLLKAQGQKTRLVTAVFKLPAEGTFSDFRKKELIENLLYTQEGNQPVMEIPSPIVTDSYSVELVQPLECLIMINSNGLIQLFNPKLDLQAEARTLPEAIQSINKQFIDLLNKQYENSDYVDEKTQELDRLMGI